MKGKTHERKHRETGGVNDAREDIDSKPMRYTADSKVNSEAEERKHGGKAKHGKDCKCHRCMGGRAGHKMGGHVEGKKHVGKVHGEHEKHRMDRKPRKSGGRTGADSHPFSSARHGTNPKGRTEMDME